MISPDLNPRVIACTRAGDIIAEMRWAGAADERIEAVASNSETLAIVIENVPPSAAYILKRQMRAHKGDVVVHDPLWSEVSFKTAMVLVGTRPQFQRFIEYMSGGEVVVTPIAAAWYGLFGKRRRPFPAEIVEVAEAIQEAISGYDRRHFVIEACSKRIELGPRPAIMGILNVTPDSFSDGGRFFSPDRAVEQALKLVGDGADILDIGGESTRPGSDAVSAQDEIQRVVPVIEALSEKVDVPISIDTQKSAVAREALKAGASIVNDISGLNADEEMARVVASSGAALVVMHIRGTPQTMQEDPSYDHLMSQVCRFLRLSIQRAVKAGVDEEKIIIDPGIGFGKRLEHNLELLRKVRQLRSLGRPVLVGTSRKSFIGQVTGAPVERRLFGTAASVACSLAQGALVFRMHDVAEIAEVLKVAGAISEAKSTIKASRENVAANN